MKLSLTGQRPTHLDPVHLTPLGGEFDPMSSLKKAMVEPLFDPINQNHPVSVVDDKRNQYDEDDIVDLIGRTTAPGVDSDAEEAMKSLFSQGLIRFDANSNLLTNEVYAVQAAAAMKLPTPTPMIKYMSGSDVVPAAKELLAGKAANDLTFFTALGFTYNPELLGFWFLTESEFDEFKTWLNAHTQTLSSVLPTDTKKLLADFQAVTLPELTETIVLRGDDTDENHEFSFARVIVDALMQYEVQQRTARQQAGTQATLTSGVLPFNTSELFVPKVLALVNVEAHARRSPKKIDNEWKLINAAISSPVKVVSNKTLSKLTSLARASAKASARAANAQTNKFAKSGRSASVKFRKTAPSKVDLFKGVTRALKKMKEVNRSQNAYKTVSISFNKANRRDPDDYNKPGKITSVRYLPDIHIYLDCSGSISERNYQDAVIMLIKMAKKLNVNLYFTSFSHIMSQEVLLRTENRSVAQIWKEFRRIPKVNGGTEFSQVWRYINASPTRKKRFSLMITDFEWQPRPHRQDHPKNLHYGPVSGTEWSRISRWAKKFEKSMRHIEPAIANRLIGLIN